MVEWSLSMTKPDRMENVIRVTEEDIKKAREDIYAICKDPKNRRLTIPQQEDDFDNLFMRIVDFAESRLRINK